jgi:hypothetical protein
MSHAPSSTLDERNAQHKHDQRLRELRQAVRDLPDADKGNRITQEDVDVLRRAGFDDLAEIAERYL